MKLRYYLNEINISNNDELDYHIQEIRKRCKPFLSKLNKNYRSNYYFVSGRKNIDDIIIKTIRKDRRPLNTKEWIHDILNKYFEEIWGFKARSESLFTYILRYNWLKNNNFPYGNGFLIFPIGDFKILYNKEITDLYLDLSQDITEKYPVIARKIINFHEKYPEEVKEVTKMLKDIVKNYEYWDGKWSIKNNPEYMIHCDKVYMIKINDFLNKDDRADYFLSRIFKGL